MLSFKDQMTALVELFNTEDKAIERFSTSLQPIINKLSEGSRSTVKRCKEQCLEDAFQLLKKIPEAELSSLEESHLLLLVRLLISMQLEMVNISIACRKLDQMLQHLATVSYQLVFRETCQCLHGIVHNNQILSIDDLQKACMFLEDSVIGRDVWRVTFPDVLNKMSQLFPAVMEQDGLRNGPHCYAAIKVCLQMFQLLAGEVAPLAWERNCGSSDLQDILKSLMDIILGQCSNRDSRLLSGTTVAMLINTAPERGAGGAAAQSLLRVSCPEPWQLSVGVLQVQCVSQGQDGVGRLAVCRGLLTCCQPEILLRPSGDSGLCLLLADVFPIVCALCEEKLDCHYYVFQVLTLWLKKAKACLPAIWEMTGVRLLPDRSSLQQQLLGVIWNNAESPVEGVSEFVRGAFRLLLELYEMDCGRFGDTTKSMYSSLLWRVTKLPWEAKAKYPPLCALIPYTGADVVLDRYLELPKHLLKCLSTNHLSPFASELYKCLIEQQRRELCSAPPNAPPPTELDLANHWARPWLPVLLEALRSTASLVQTNASTHLLPATLQVFPAAVEPLLASLEPDTPENLHAWTCVLGVYRATAGGSPWTLQGDWGRERLRLALGSAEDKVRIAAFNLLCCTPKTKEAPTPLELTKMRTFIPQNLNSESSPFRQHFQAGVKRFLVRLRDSCLARVREPKGKKKKGDGSSRQEEEAILAQGVDFVDWLSLLPYSYLAPGHSYQRKKSVLLLLAAVLETCTDSWSPEKRKGKPPVNMSALITWARQRKQWDFFCREKQLTLIGCLEDSTNEIRELSAGLLLRFFPPTFPDGISSLLFGRSRQLLCSPRVPQAQMGALMLKVLLHKCPDVRTQEPWTDGNVDIHGSCPDVRTQEPWTDGNVDIHGSVNLQKSGLVRYLVRELEHHYLTARVDMLVAARTKPLHGALRALERCLMEGPRRLCDTVDHSLVVEVLELLENISVLLLGVLYGAQEAVVEENDDVPPSFCDMGNAISSLISQRAGGSRGEEEEDEEECVLLSEEHSLVLTCCWVSLKGIGIFLGVLVERLLAENKPGEDLLTTEDLKRTSKVFKNILLKCRHWGAVEGCGVGFTKFCSALLSSGDVDWRAIPAHMLRQGLRVVQSPRSSSVTRRGAGLPMLLLCVVTAEEANRARPLLSHAVSTLLDTARTPLPHNWDHTLDLPQVCAVHTLQALVRGSGLGVAMLQFASDVAILSLTLLSSPCWAMRNAALQLYSSLCSRVLGQRPGGEVGGLVRHGMSAPAFFVHYSALQPFLLGELSGAASDLQGPVGEARLHLHPSLYPILTLLAKLQPGVPDPPRALTDFLAPLLQLAASPIYSVRAMAAQALVAITTPPEYPNILLQLTAELSESRERRRCHNMLHGRLLQTKALLDRALSTNRDASSALQEVVSRVESSFWLATGAQRCPLVRAAYLALVGSIREMCCQGFLHKLSNTLLHELTYPQPRLQVGSLFYHQTASQFLCADPEWACQMWEGFSSVSPDVKLSLVTWIVNGHGLGEAKLCQVIRRVLQTNLRVALLSNCVEYRRTYLAALVAVMTTSSSYCIFEPTHPSQAGPAEGAELQQCLELLLGDLEAERGGPELLSRVLCAASGLLGQSLQVSTLQRWCSVLEAHRSPEAPEVLRAACAEALCLAGHHLMRPAGTEGFPDVSARLLNTCLYLLQDESQQVRMTAARYASTLRHSRRGGGGGGGGGGQGSLHLMQVNQEVALVVVLLSESCWKSPVTLEMLLSHVPGPDLSSVLTEAQESRCSSLYEQDQANVFSEPSVMTAFLLPPLLRVADGYSRWPALAQRLRAWVSENAAQVLDNLALCKTLLPGEALSAAWLALLMHSRFHSTLCGLFARAAFLLRLLRNSSDFRTLERDPLTLQKNIQDLFGLLVGNGLHFPSTIIATVSGDHAL